MWQEYPENICACIDVGFVVMCRDELNLLFNGQTKSILENVASIIAKRTKEYIISIVGNRILVSLFYSSSCDQNGNKIPMDSGVQNFIEIMNDGSVRFRIILSNEINSTKADITAIQVLINLYQEIYEAIVGDDFYKNFVYARIYERLTVLRQFIPHYFWRGNVSEKIKSDFFQFERGNNEKFGINHIIIGNRFPADGFYRLDKHLFDKLNIPWTTNEIVKYLVYTSYRNLGFVEKPIFNKE